MEGGECRRCAERLVLGESFISTAGAADIDRVNVIARRASQ